MVRAKIVRVSKSKDRVHIEFPDGIIRFYLLESMEENIPDICNADEWDMLCPSNCGNNLVGIINHLGDQYGFCSKCDQWYNIETGKTCENPFEYNLEN